MPMFRLDSNHLFTKTLPPRLGSPSISILLANYVSGCWMSHEFDKGGLARSGVGHAIQPLPDAYQVQGRAGEDVLQMDFGQAPVPGPA